MRAAAALLALAVLAVAACDAQETMAAESAAAAAGIVVGEAVSDAVPCARPSPWFRAREDGTRMGASPCRLDRLPVLQAAASPAPQPAAEDAPHADELGDVKKSTGAGRRPIPVSSRWRGMVCSTRARDGWRRGWHG